MSCMLFQFTFYIFFFALKSQMSDRHSLVHQLFEGIDADADMPLYKFIGDFPVAVFRFYTFGDHRLITYQQ